MAANFTDTPFDVIDERAFECVNTLDWSQGAVLCFLHRKEDPVTTFRTTAAADAFSQRVRLEFGLSIVSTPLAHEQVFLFDPPALRSWEYVEVHRPIFAPAWWKDIPDHRPIASALRWAALKRFVVVNPDAEITERRLVILTSTGLRVATCAGTRDPNVEYKVVSHAPGPPS